MLERRRPPDPGESRRYLVKCEGCSFERQADGRDEATALGTDHRRESTHEVVVVEVPPRFNTS